MKSLIKRIMSQAGIEPEYMEWTEGAMYSAWVPITKDYFSKHQKECETFYTEQDVYKACELVAREWANNKVEQQGNKIAEGGRGND
jgi:hypothetical protein